MPRKILLIDDDRLQFSLAQAHLRNFRTDSYEIHWSATYKEGLEQLLSGDYAACLLDYQLGEHDGLQLIREAVARGGRTPIIFLTAETAEHVDIEAMNAGALDYLVKGEFTPRMLERSLRYALKLGDTMEQLRHLATRDALTGLLNRREFDRILTEEQERAQRFDSDLALMLLDLDHFKRVNDSHGHLVGDEVMREVARRLASEVRTVDRVARFGGEEFALILLQADEAAALEVAKRICRNFEHTPITASPQLTLRVTLSAGVAKLRPEAKSREEFIAAADQALYAAKARGRNRAVGFTEL